MTTSPAFIRVSQVRSANPQAVGGCIFSGRGIDADGNVIDTAALFVVKVPGKLLGAAQVHVGQWWKVSGNPTIQLREVDGYRFQEWQIDAVSATLARPSGEHIISVLADSPEFAGVGMVKARRLWDAFGELLFRHLDEGNVDELSRVISAPVAEQLVAAWTQYGDAETVQWLHAQGIDAVLTSKLVQFFGKATREKLEEDPYRLLSFCGSWNEVDALARSHFLVNDADERRLRAAVEEALYRMFDDGHTAAKVEELESRLEQLLGPLPAAAPPWMNLVHAALDAGIDNGSFVIGPCGLLHSLGPYVMEMTVAKRIGALVGRAEAAFLPPDEVATAIDAFQGTLVHPLTGEQRHAIEVANASAFAVIAGGAGVGKTTVLNALYQLYDRAGVKVYQMALAGRAAKRMHTATGRPSTTIASFLLQCGSIDWEEPAVVVVDEASMVDIITMSRLCDAIPPSVRLLLVGDDGQLAPVGPGLVLHALMAADWVPTARLTQVHRYRGSIALAAASVRAGHWPGLSGNTTHPISFVPCAGRDVAAQVLELYRQDPDNTQILTTRRKGLDGTGAINALVQEHLTSGNRRLTVWNDEHGRSEMSGLHLDDKVMCTRNHWGLGLQNGTLGRLVEIYDAPLEVTGADGETVEAALGAITWDDGVTRHLYASLLDDVELGYAITVHKAQGSQWPVVVVALTANRVLDRTLVYTAMTRASQKVAFVGDPVAARDAVAAATKAAQRCIGLGQLLGQVRPAPAKPGR